MAISARSIFLAATMLFAPVAGPAGAGSHDGLWNVIIITQAGNCDAAYAYPFRIIGSRITSAAVLIFPAGSVARRRPGEDLGRRLGG